MERGKQNKTRIRQLQFYTDDHEARESAATLEELEEKREWYENCTDCWTTAGWQWIALNCIYYAWQKDKHILQFFLDEASLQKCQIYTSIRLACNKFVNHERNIKEDFSKNMAKFTETNATFKMIWVLKTSPKKRKQFNNLLYFLKQSILLTMWLTLRII